VRTRNFVQPILNGSVRPGQTICCTGFGRESARLVGDRAGKGNHHQIAVLSSQPAVIGRLFLTVEEAAQRLGVTVGSIYERTRRKTIPHRKLGKFVRFTEEDLRAIVEAACNEVNVRHAISKRRGTDGSHKWEWHVGPPKSRKSLRRIDATDSVMKMLADLKVGKPDGAFIFPGDCNGFIDPHQFDAEVWKPIAEKARMAGTRFHDMRHFFASQLIAQGETAAYSSRPDGPLQHQGYVRYLRISFPRPRQGSQRPLRKVDGRCEDPPQNGGQC
jgi:excisionase family DNA binding protein